jgi:adenine deaminase
MKILYTSSRRVTTTIRCFHSPAFCVVDCICLRLINRQSPKLSGNIAGNTTVNSNHLRILANVVDIESESITASEIRIAHGVIQSITRLAAHESSPDPSLPYALPGFIDAHIHVESSMLTPSEFARMAVTHGTVATVSDPHEIANVLGVEGVNFMIRNGNQVRFKFCFGAPSCVPATTFETSGAVIDAEKVSELMSRDDIGYLAEMMNYPGVLADDPQVVAKVRSAHRVGKPVDGHAPGLTGDQAMAYAHAGISTDHECTTLNEALHKLDCGMKILIREGSAARNYEALKSLIDSHPARVMFCSDDKHPDELALGHINRLVSRAVADGANPFNVLRAACLNAVDHYRLPVGRLRAGDAADFILVSDLRDFPIQQVYIDGHLVAENGRSLIAPVATVPINHFQCAPTKPADFRLPAVNQSPSAWVRVIEASDGSLVTGESRAQLDVIAGDVAPDIAADVLKIVVVNRYQPASPAVAFMRGFGLKAGAIASSVAHDSHNILAVGVDDDSISRAVNQVIASHGGIAATDGEADQLLPLPIAGIMSDRDGSWVAERYQRIDRFVKEILQSPLAAPFMTLSFMALLVIPKLKLSDLGLFDSEPFAFVPVIVNSEV